MTKAETHRFFCTSCGKEGIHIARKPNKKRERMHLKRIWCIHCKKVVNHVECITEDDIEKFRERYEIGDYRKNERKMD